MSWHVWQVRSRSARASPSGVAAPPCAAASRSAPAGAAPARGLPPRARRLTAVPHDIGDHRFDLIRHDLRSTADHEEDGAPPLLRGLLIDLDHSADVGVTCGACLPDHLSPLVNLSLLCAIRRSRGDLGCQLAGLAARRKPTPRDSKSGRKESFAFRSSARFLLRGSCVGLCYAFSLFFRISAREYF